MNCSCCGKKKRLFESYEELTKKVFVCVECSKKLYKYQDFKKEKNDGEAEKILAEIKSKKNAKEFTAWLETFLARFNKKKPVTEDKENHASSTEKS